MDLPRRLGGASRLRRSYHTQWDLSRAKNELVRLRPTDGHPLTSAHDGACSSMSGRARAFEHAAGTLAVAVLGRGEMVQGVSAHGRTFLLKNKLLRKAHPCRKKWTLESPRIAQHVEEASSEAPFLLSAGVWTCVGHMASYEAVFLHLRP